MHTDVGTAPDGCTHWSHPPPTTSCWPSSSAGRGPGWPPVTSRSPSCCRGSPSTCAPSCPVSRCASSGRPPPGPPRASPSSWTWCGARPRRAAGCAWWARCTRPPPSGGSGTSGAQRGRLRAPAGCRPAVDPVPLRPPHHPAGGAGGRAAHPPAALADRRLLPNPAHLAPADAVAALGTPVEPLQATEPAFAVDDAPSLPELRHALSAALRGRFADRDTEEDVHLAPARSRPTPSGTVAAGLGARLGRRRPGGADHLRQRPARSTAGWPATGPRTATTSPTAAWGSGWPASSATTSTSSGRDRLTVRLTTATRGRA